MSTENTLNKLSAGPDFAKYLLANGWALTKCTIGDSTDELVFEKEIHRSIAGLNIHIDHRITYTCTDQHSKFFHETKHHGHKAYNTHSTLTGILNEHDLASFAFMCHAMGWVSITEANLNIELQHGVTLASMFSEEFAGTKRIAKNIMQQVADELQS